MSGAARKNSQLKPVTRAFVKVTTLTTESWAFAYQPSQTQREGEISPPDPHVDAWPPHQRVLEEEDRGQHQQPGNGDRDRDRIGLPDLEPKRLIERRRPAVRRRRRATEPERRAGRPQGRAVQAAGRRRRLLDSEILVGKGVSEVEGQKGLLACSDAALDDQLQLPGFGEIEGELLRHNEQRDLAQLRRALSREIAKSRMVAVAEARALAILEELDAVEDSAADVP